MKVLRKLTPVEHVLAHYAQFGNLIYPCSFIIESKIDLYSHIKEIENSITKWISLHPLLAVNLKYDRTDGYYFVKADEKIISSLENVLFLKHNQIEIKDCWKVLHHYEFENSIDPKKQLLWRLTILEIEKSQAFSNYAFIFTVHHSLSDGSNNYAILTELLNLIEQSVMNKSIKECLNQTLYDFEIEFPNDPRYGNVSKDLNWVPSNEQVELIILPDYIKNQPKEILFEKKRGEYTSLNNKIYSSYNELIEKINSSNTGFLTICIKQDVYSNFLSKCKQKNIKLNSVFEVICSIAYKKLVSQLGGINIDQVKYAVSINLRPYLSLPNTIMGCWIDYFINELNLNLNELNDSFWLNEFWLLCKKQQEILHKYIDERKFFDVKVVEEMANRVYITEHGGFKCKDVIINYTLSNLGDKTHTESKLFRINECYAGVSYGESDYEFGLFTTYTFDKTACWSFCYNRKLICDKAAKIFLNLIQDCIQRI